MDSSLTAFSVSFRSAPQEADPHQEEKGQDLARTKEETFQHTIPPFRAGRAPHLG
jgi:hypothetical protein